MATIKCFDCGKTVPDDVANCPQCGRVIADKRSEDRRRANESEDDHTKRLAEERRKKGDRRGFSY